MKKLMIAAAIVCAAALSQGAQLNWKLTSIPDSPDTAVAVGWKGYWMDGSTWAAFSALAPDKVAGYVTANYTDTANMTVARQAGTFNGKFGNWSYDSENPQVVSGYMVIFNDDTPADATYYAYTEKLDSTVPSSGNMTPGGDFAVMTAGWKATSAVPEPTSGLLLLLGVAGLALKRRRA